MPSAGLSADCSGCHRTRRETCCRECARGTCVVYLLCRAGWEHRREDPFNPSVDLHPQGFRARSCRVEAERGREVQVVGLGCYSVRIYRQTLFPNSKLFFPNFFSQRARADHLQLFFSKSAFREMFLFEAGRKGSDLQRYCRALGLVVRLRLILYPLEGAKRELSERTANVLRG